jgi:hypothetical protein
MNTTNKLLIAESPLDDIGENTIRDFIHSNLDENYTVELKVYTKNDPSFTYNLRKTLASFANNQGGFLLVGIKDKKNSKNTTDDQERVTGFSFAEEPQKWVDDICKQSNILPRPKYDTAIINVNNKKVLIVKVSPYIIGPVAIKGRESDLLEFWIRGNGSNIGMDYTVISSKYLSKSSAIIKRAFIDLNDTLTDVLELQKQPIQINSYNPIKITSSFVDDRIFYYEVIGYNEEIMLSIKNLRKVLIAYNGCVDIGNKSHLEGKSINNSDDVVQAMSGYLEVAGKEIINIVVELHQLFPDEGVEYFSYIQKLAKEHDESASGS